MEQLKCTKVTKVKDVASSVCASATTQVKDVASTMCASAKNVIIPPPPTPPPSTLHECENASHYWRGFHPVGSNKYPPLGGDMWCDRSQVVMMVIKFCCLETISDSSQSSLAYHQLPPVVFSWYTPQNKHGTWKWTLGKGDSYWKPSFPGSMLVFWGVVFFLATKRRLVWFGGVHSFEIDQPLEGFCPSVLRHPFLK